MTAGPSTAKNGDTLGLAGSLSLCNVKTHLCRRRLSHIPRSSAGEVVNLGLGSSAAGPAGHQ